MKAVSVLIVALAMAGCAQTQSGYQQFYTPYDDPRTNPLVESLGDNQDPQVFGSDDFKRDIRLLFAKRYVVIGESSFNGGYEGVEHAIAALE